MLKEKEQSKIQDDSQECFSSYGEFLAWKEDVKNKQWQAIEEGRISPEEAQRINGIDWSQCKIIANY